MSLDLGTGGTAALIGAALGVLGFLLRKGWKLNRLLVLGLNDIVGSEQRPGLVMQLDSLRGEVRKIDKELHPNGGSSMRDQIVRVETQLAEVRKDAAEAKQKAADAASEAEGLAGSIARFHHDSRARADVAGRERRGVQETLEVLLRSLAEFAQEGYQKERAYVAALQSLGIDLTNVTAELDSGDDG